jgi:hypothetical protein
MRGVDFQERKLFTVFSSWHIPLTAGHRASAMRFWPQAAHVNLARVDFLLSDSFTP